MILKLFKIQLYLVPSFFCFLFYWIFSPEWEPFSARYFLAAIRDDWELALFLGAIIIGSFTSIFLWRKHPKIATFVSGFILLIVSFFLLQIFVFP